MAACKGVKTKEYLHGIAVMSLVLAAVLTLVRLVHTVIGAVTQPPNTHNSPVMRW